MTEVNYTYVGNTTDGYTPIKMWDGGGALKFEGQALAQLRNVSKLPFIYKHVAAMPDCHWGYGATIGSVIATKGAIVPAAVGVDIGCGMGAVRTKFYGRQLGDNLRGLRMSIEERIPHGRTANGNGINDVGGWCGDPSENTIDLWNMFLSHRYAELVGKHPKAEAYNTVNHLGTLGTGNHFIEVCLDEEDRVWLMLHSGSRGLGNKIGQYFIEQAKSEMEKYFISSLIPDKDLAYLVEHTEIFDDYVEALDLAQEFARLNRQIMMEELLVIFYRYMGDAETFPIKIDGQEIAVNCHHNYAVKEHHYGKNVWVTRKGAVRARTGDLGIIPGSMGTESFIVRGLGNTDSFHSCSHGAGRKMSRGRAKKEITLDQHVAAMAGIEGRLDADVLDESPAAYKDINQVMAAQSDLVEVVHTLHQVVNVKG